MFIPQSSLETAVLFKLFVYSQNHDKRLKKEEISKLFDFDLSSKRVELALDRLVESGFVDKSLTSNTYAITARGYLDVERNLSNGQSGLFQYYQLGDDWLQNQTLPIDGVPASNRIVNRGHNSHEISVIESQLDEISEALRSNNELSDSLGEEKDLIQSEIEASKILVKSPNFRLGRLISLLMPALKFLAEKFASGAVGETAKLLITLLLGLK